MNLYIFSDESGVFDQKHNDYFVYGGIIFLGNEQLRNCNTRYVSLERRIKNKYKIPADTELKASSIPPKERKRLYQISKNYFRFGALVEQKKIDAHIFADKKTKQRYLDYVFKIALKKAIAHILKSEEMKNEIIESIQIVADEHTTATNGRYELQEALEREFKFGTFNYNWDKYFEPITSDLQSLTVKFKDSKSNTLIRAADIIANKILYDTVHQIYSPKDKKLFIKVFP